MIVGRTVKRSCGRRSSGHLSSERREHNVNTCEELERLPQALPRGRSGPVAKCLASSYRSIPEIHSLSSNGTDKSDVPMCFQPPYCQLQVQSQRTLARRVDSPASHWIVQFEVSKSWACEQAGQTRPGICRKRPEAPRVIKNSVPSSSLCFEH